MSGGFRRSSAFGLIGVVVVMVAVAAIALQFGSGTARPTGALIAIVGIVFGFIVVLMVVQRRDLNRVAGAAEREAIADVGPVSDPTTVPPGSLIAAMAVRPVDERALSGAAAWGLARSSMNSAAVMVVLVFLAAAPWIIFQWIWSIVIVGPIIGIYLLYLVARILIPSGTVGKAFQASADMLSPLGLEMTQQPRVGLNPRIDRPGYSGRMVGTYAAEGERHGRHVSMRRPGDGPTVTSVAGAYPEFTIKSDGDRLRAARGAPPAIGRALGSLSRSKRWKGVEVRAGDDGISVKRRSDSGSDWLCDLWLAERLADSLRA